MKSTSGTPQRVGKPIVRQKAKLEMFSMCTCYRLCILQDAVQLRGSQIYVKMAKVYRRAESDHHECEHQGIMSRACLQKKEQDYEGEHTVTIENTYAPNISALE